MLIILVNQLLLSVIDTLAFQKKMIKLSSTQLTIFNLCFLYMSINSFIIPALSMTTMESIFSFLSTNGVEKVETLLKTFYLKDTGSLFIIMLIQAGTFSFTFYLLDFPIFSWTISIGSWSARKDNRDSYWRTGRKTKAKISSMDTSMRIWWFIW